MIGSINDLRFHWNMPKGLKETSSQIVVSFSTDETAANTFTEERIDLQLNALDNEVFVVTGVNMDLSDPILNLADPVANFGDAERNVRAFVSKQSIANATIKGLGNPSVFATAKKSFQIQNTTAVAGGNFLPVVPFMEDATDAPYDVEYLDIIATPDFYVSVVSQTGLGGDAGSVQGKIYGYRARADASTYAALVQSELLSQ